MNIYLSWSDVSEVWIFILVLLILRNLMPDFDRTVLFWLCCVLPLYHRLLLPSLLCQSSVGYRLDFFEPLSRNELVRVYVTFSLFLIGFCFGRNSWACFADFEMKSQNSIGKRDFIDYMNRADVWILRRHMSIIFVGRFTSRIFYLPSRINLYFFYKVVGFV